MFEEPIRLSASPWDWTFSVLLALAWCVWTLWMLRKRPRIEIGAASSLVVHASQTGHAADIAERTQLRIEAAGEACALVEADRLTVGMLSRARKVFFVVSTTGEGEAPDNARRFERRLLADKVDLSTVRTAVLALGDRRYPAFCAFGRKIDAWVRGCGAGMLAPLVEVDDLASGDLAVWDARLASLGYPARENLARNKQRQWRIVEREQVAGPSRDADGDLVTDGLYRVVLCPTDAAMPSWEIGDLFELHTPDGHVRNYSIANRPDPSEIRLFVRRVVDKGVVGHGSGHLTDTEVGSSVTGHVRPHRSFHTPTGDGSLLAIGAGSGWAGLRPHLLHAMALGESCRLIFGEREEGTPLLSEMRGWHAGGKLDRLDLALSRASAGGSRYVQHAIAEQGGGVADFLGDRGRIILCGGLAMGEQSLLALAEILGRDWLDKAQEDGRLRRDLY